MLHKKKVPKSQEKGVNFGFFIIQNGKFEGLIFLNVFCCFFDIFQASICHHRKILKFGNIKLRFDELRTLRPRASCMESPRTRASTSGRPFRVKPILGSMNNFH